MQIPAETEMYLRARKHLRALILGIHPLTQSKVQDESALADPEVIRSLVLALEALEKVETTRPKEKTNLDSRAGQSWDEKEDARLAEEFQQGRTLNEMMFEHRRGEGGIIARLVHLKLVSSRDEARAMFGHKRK